MSRRRDARQVGRTFGVQAQRRSVCAVLKVQDISRRFGNVFALKDVNFHVRGGEVLGLIGPNGAGKTTLLEILSGLLLADRGSVFWESAPLVPSRRKQVLFYVPDSIIPYPQQTTVAVLRLFARLFGQTNDALARTIGDLALSSVLDTRVGALSKGYRKRLLLAVGLLANQPLIVIDEPFDGLDLRQTREVMDVLRHRVAGGRTLLLSIHQLTDAERLCNRFVLLSDGAVRGEGNLQELRQRAGVGEAGLEEVFLALT
jgi:ABC-2 type transport system ATP-binding protein